ncbi:MAG: SMP-30/gluconolactonase/LRE family protein [Alphaproteobacteria bacterium]|jgi:sugar lactone lactonase YvrE|nr:SMP-30/gluconolactonase/LRE family protein [Alphaproteobacteria bacterium]
MANERRVLLDGLTFPEGPRWHEGRLWFSDFYSHRVIVLASDGAAETIVEVPRQPSGLGWLPDGRLLVVSMLDRKLLRLDPGGLAEAADISTIATGPCNDMVVDGEGRAYVGNFGYDRHAGEAERPAKLARADADGTVAVVAEDLGFPNGMVITPDGETLIAAETTNHRLTAWRRDADGGLAGQRLFADLGENVPDGICLDAEGGVWVADPRNNEVIRVRDGGAVTARISTGDLGAYACMLGDDDRQTLYICTNTTSGPGAAEAKGGRIEAVRVEVPGVGWP